MCGIFDIVTFLNNFLEWSEWSFESEEPSVKLSDSYSFWFKISFLGLFLFFFGSSCLNLKTDGIDPFTNDFFSISTTNSKAVNREVKFANFWWFFYWKRVISALSTELRNYFYPLLPNSGVTWKREKANNRFITVTNKGWAFTQWYTAKVSTTNYSKFSRTRGESIWIKLSSLSND